MVVRPGSARDLVAGIQYTKTVMPMNNPDPLFDVELWLRTLLVIVAVCAVFSIAAVIAGTFYFLKAREYWRKAPKLPEVARDHNGRPIRERI